MSIAVRYRCAAFLPALFFALAVRAGAETYPAGSRLSILSPGETKFWIDADGPSLLWIRAEAVGLTELQAGTDEVWAAVDPLMGRAECVIPVYRPGSVEIRLKTRSNERVVVATNYGLGAVVTDPRVIGTPKSSALAAAPMKPSSTVRESSAAASAPTVATMTPEPARPVPSTATAAAAEAALNALSGAPSPTVEAKRIVPLADQRTTFIFGDAVQGDIPPSNPPGVRTFRMYAPNRSGFEVVLSGNPALRVVSEKPGFDVTRSGDEPVKRIRVAEPTTGYYLISVQGLGEYVLMVKSVE